MHMSIQNPYESLDDEDYPVIDDPSAIDTSIGSPHWHLMHDHSEFVDVQRDTDPVLRTGSKVVDIVTLDTEVSVEDLARLDAVRADIRRLQIDHNGLYFLLKERPAVVPELGGSTYEEIEKARLAMIRAISDIKGALRELQATYPTDLDIGLMYGMSETLLTEENIHALQRLFVGGKTGSSAKTGELTTHVKDKAHRKGIKPEETEDIVIIGPPGLQMISHVALQDGQ